MVGDSKVWDLRLVYSIFNLFQLNHATWQFVRPWVSIYIRWVLIDASHRWSLQIFSCRVPVNASGVSINASGVSINASGVLINALLQCRVYSVMMTSWSFWDLNRCRPTARVCIDRHWGRITNISFVHSTQHSRSMILSPFSILGSARCLGFSSSFFITSTIYWTWNYGLFTWVFGHSTQCRQFLTAY